MTIAVVSLVAVLAFIALLMRMEKRSRGANGSQEGRIEPLRGTPLRMAPDDWVEVRRGLGRSEAEVARGLLESSGIKAAVASSGILTAEFGSPPGPGTAFAISVSPADADVARELLGP